jgi:hypothetical protein
MTPDELKKLTDALNANAAEVARKTAAAREAQRLKDLGELTDKLNADAAAYVARQSAASVERARSDYGPLLLLAGAAFWVLMRRKGSR